MRPAGTRRSLAYAALSTCALVVTGCGLQQGLDQQPGAGATAPTAAAAISGRTLTGAQLSWASMRGHPVVIDFWASWCGPCRAEQPDINTVAAAYASRGVDFVGVDMRDDAAAALAYRRDLNVTYDSVPDATQQIASSYNVAAPPTVVLVDQRGMIVDRFLGTVVGLRDDLNRLLKT